MPACTALSGTVRYSTVNYSTVLRFGKGALRRCHFCSCLLCRCGSFGAPGTTYHPTNVCVSGQTCSAAGTCCACKASSAVITALNAAVQSAIVLLCILACTRGTELLAPPPAGLSCPSLSAVAPCACACACAYRAGVAFSLAAGICSRLFAVCEFQAAMAPQPTLYISAQHWDASLSTRPWPLLDSIVMYCPVV